MMDRVCAIKSDGCLGELFWAGGQMLDSRIERTINYNCVDYHSFSLADFFSSCLEKS
jgi:hypothetical protein